MEDNIIVMKFGGTSVGDPQKIRNVAAKAIEAKKKGKDVVITVSAMGHTTDELIALSKSIAAQPSKREMDMLLSTGEQVSIALLAMAIEEQNVKAISLTGSQAGILTDPVYSEAKIHNIDTRRIFRELKQDKIVIVAGFQGINEHGDITTLGRGGSDTTAVAVASALDAKYCEIFTDVDGVYTTDPNIVSNAKKISAVSYDEMLELASSGAKVLHLRAVEFAKKHGVVIHVRSSFNDSEGTWIMDMDKEMEQAVVSGVSYDENQVKISVFGIPDRPGIAARLFDAFAKENINVDMIVQNVGEGGIAAISFTIKNEDLVGAKQVIEDIKDRLQIQEIAIDPGIAKVSIVGAGMKTHPGVAAKMFACLGDHGINIEMISTSPIIISCVIRKEKTKEAVRIIHACFELDK